MTGTLPLVPSSIAAEIKQSRPFATRAEEAGVALLRTADLVRRNLSAVLAQHDITLQQYNVLRILRGAGETGRTTLDIAGRMIEETPGITRLLDRIEAKGLVGRERCSEDRRRVWCRITKEGQDLLAALETPMRDALESAMNGLRKRDLADLLDLLDRARGGLNHSLTHQRARNAAQR
jgi:DNA-binding MarR family transcriptional regulator